MGSLIEPNLENSFNFIPVDDKYKWEAFPSVTKGSINIANIKRLLKFEPSKVRESFRESIEFYNRASEKFPHEKKRIEKLIKKEILTGDDQIEQFNKFISKNN